jgi:hypothetical protein
MAEADFLNALGYVSLVVDSVTPRRIVEACISPAPDRHADALGALSYLAKLRYVDPKRIALVGRSQAALLRSRLPRVSRFPFTTSRTVSPTRRALRSTPIATPPPTSLNCRR